jgi:hypothetical protein
MRITQTSAFLKGLIQDAMKGHMLPAAMQRPYVWLKDDVEALCDSILSGFPIGSFVLWQPDSKADLSTVAKGRLGPIMAADSDGNAYNPTQLLLDGQNRLASLAWMMIQDFSTVKIDNPFEGESATWLSGQRLVLDFDSRSIKFVPADEAEKGLRLPVWTLADHGGMAHLRKRWNDWMADGISEAEADEFLKFHDLCQSKFLDARTTITIIEDATVEQARSAFLRICNVGVQMSAEDFDKAVGWSAQPAA